MAKELYNVILPNCKVDTSINVAKNLNVRHDTFMNFLKDNFKVFVNDGKEKLDVSSVNINLPIVIHTQREYRDKFVDIFLLNEVAIKEISVKDNLLIRTQSSKQQQPQCECSSVNKESSPTKTQTSTESSKVSDTHVVTVTCSSPNEVNELQKYVKKDSILKQSVNEYTQIIVVNGEQKVNKNYEASITFPTNIEIHGKISFEQFIQCQKVELDLSKPKPYQVLLVEYIGTTPIYFKFKTFHTKDIGLNVILGHNYIHFSKLSSTAGQCGEMRQWYYFPIDEIGKFNSFARWKQTMVIDF